MCIKYSCPQKINHIYLEQNVLVLQGNYIYRYLILCFIKFLKDIMLILNLIMSKVPLKMLKIMQFSLIRYGFTLLCNLLKFIPIQFLKFAKALHKEGIKITVDVASWNSIWDFKLIGQTDVDRVMCVTYKYFYIFYSYN